MQNPAPSSYRWVVLLLCCLATAIPISGISSFQVLSPLLAEKLVLSGTQSMQLLSLYTWGLWLGFAVAGPSISFIGIRATLTGGLLCFSLPQFLIPFTDSLLPILALRFIQGLCSVCIPIMLSYVSSSGWFPPSEQGLSTGMIFGALNAGAYLGSSLSSPFLAGGATLPMCLLGGCALAVSAAVHLGLRPPDTKTRARCTADTDKTPAAHPLSLWPTWVLLLLFIPIRAAYWAMPLVWPVYAGWLGFSAGQFDAVYAMIGMLGFMGILGGAVSDLVLKKTDDIMLARVGMLLICLALTGGAIVATAMAHTLVPLLWTLVLLSSIHAGSTIFWTLLGIVYPPDPIFMGRCASVITFAGNSPVIFILPVCAWLAAETSWSTAFLVFGAAFTASSVLLMYPLKHIVAKKEHNCRSAAPLE